MPGPVTTSVFRDTDTEQHAMRQAGMLGRGHNTHSVFSIDYLSLPPEARTTIGLIISNGPFPYPGKDGSSFGNNFGDLPSGAYLEFTVPTPGATNRGARRIVARKSSGQLFFTACHYERVHVTGGNATDRSAARVTATASVDEDWQNGFYLVTGMTIDLRNQIRDAIRKNWP